MVEELLRKAPAYVPFGDPRKNELRRAQQLWRSIGEAVVHGDAELRSKAAKLAMEFVSEALDAPDCKQRFGIDGLID